MEAGARPTSSQSPFKLIFEECPSSPNKRCCPAPPRLPDEQLRRRDPQLLGHGHDRGVGQPLRLAEGRVGLRASRARGRTPRLLAPEASLVMHLFFPHTL